MSKYAIRASVLIPFLFAFAFGLAGLTVVLIDSFGYRDAYLLLAAGFGAIGLVALIAVWLKERNEEAAGAEAGSAAALASTAIETGKHIPAAVAGGASDAVSSFRGLADLAARNWPLLIAASIAAIILGGFSPEQHRYDRRHRSR